MRNIKENGLRKTVMTALFAAMICIATMLIQIPLASGGYVNMGDAAVLTAAYLLGPIYGAVAGGTGSALADLLSGHAVYVPATFVIKAGMGFIAAFIYDRVLKNHALKSRLASLIGGICGEAVMIFGYYVFSAVFLLSNAVGALAEIPANAVQAIFGISVSTVVTGILKKVYPSK